LDTARTIYCFTYTSFWVHAASVAMLLGCGRVAPQPDGLVNQSRYEVAVGDTVKIYYTTNSCCLYCSNKHKLATLDFVGEHVVTPYPEGCAGCNATSALVFVAKQAGTDTVKGKVRAVSEGCADLGAESEEYVVTVK
jgi:hypothetical protein